jgi:hypothetical protein
MENIFQTHFSTDAIPFNVSHLQGFKMMQQRPLVIADSEGARSTMMPRSIRGDLEYLKIHNVASNSG